MFKTCAINGKAVKRLYINGRLAYSSEPDLMEAVDDLALSGEFGAKDVLGSGSYQWNGSTYSYTVYDAPTAGRWCPLGAGNDNPWFAAPGLAVCAAHWASSLKTGTWTGSGGLTYDVSAWVNLRDWALENGFTSADVAGMTDVRDVVVAVNGPGATQLSAEECPWFMPADLARKAFWNGSARGCVGWHAPQKSLSAETWTCDPGSIDIEGTTFLLRAVQTGDQLALQLANEATPDTWNTAQEQTVTPDTHDVTFNAVGPDGVDVYCAKGTGPDMKLLAPVVMQANSSWQTPKNGYAAIPDRALSAQQTAASYEDTYLGYVGDSGKPTLVKVPCEGGERDVVFSQCYSQFAGPDFCACLPVLDAFAQANGKTLNKLAEDMLPS